MSFNVRPILRLTCAVAALGLFAAPRVGGQVQAATDPSNAGIAGTVRAAQDSEPLMGVQVVLKGTRRWALTNHEGAFLLDGLKAGSYTVEFRHPNRAPLAYSVTLERERIIELAVKLDTRSVALPEIVVEANVREPAAKMHDFFSHRASGNGGYFITRKEIDERQPHALSDMLRRVPGLRVECDFGTCRVNSFTEARRIMGGCPIQYFLDGLPFLGDVDEMSPDQVEGIEVYRGSSTVPPQYNTGTSMCGVIALWSRIPG